MENLIKALIETYQCPGCVCGCDITCFVPCTTGIGCGKHCAGTTIFPVVGKIYLGLPTGFNRIGNTNKFSLYIFSEYPAPNWKYDKFNIPCWKHLDENGNTIVRGLQPRLNNPFLHIYLGNYIKEINCLELATDDIESMD